MPEDVTHGGYLRGFAASWASRLPEPCGLVLTGGNEMKSNPNVRAGISVALYLT